MRPSVILRLLPLACLAVVLGLAWAGVPADETPSATTAAVPEDLAAQECATASAEAQPETELGVATVDSTENICSESVSQGRGCKPCSKDRRWCTCTYNGLPRASCDPCCYTNDIGILICLD